MSENTSSPVTRRLAAIVIADVVGYTRLMERDDTGTYARVRLIRDEVVDPAIVSHGGRVVKSAGDGLLAEFSSALAALRASIQIQRQMASRNATAIADARIDYRIGVNLGDIMVEDGDIAGDGVNVASRLEAMAEPGGICVSSAVREQVHGQLDVEFIDGGDQRVKNVARAIRVYRVDLASQQPAPPLRDGLVSNRHKVGWRRAATGVGVLVMLGATLWMVLGTPQRSVGSKATPLSIAILPFTASSKGSGNGDVADRLTRDITTSLGQWRLAHIASRGSVAASKESASDARAIERALDVQYLVGGEVGQLADRLVITAHVTDAATGAQAWSDRMEFEPALLAAEPDAVLVRAASHLRSGISRLEAHRAVEHPKPTSALNWYFRGNAAWRADSYLAGAREARKFYDEALRVNPDFGPALIGRSATLHWELYEDPAANRAQVAAEMDSLSRRALTLDPDNADAWEARADALGWLARWEEALVAIDKARAQAPWDLGLWDNEAWLNYAIGRPSRSLTIARRIIAIDPPGAGVDWYYVCRGYLMLGQYSDSVPACEKAAALDPGSWQNQLQLVAAYAQNGELDRAGATKSELLKRQPGYSIAKDRARLFSSHPEFVRQVETHLYPGLRKAGLPEQ